MAAEWLLAGSGLAATLSVAGVIVLRRGRSVAAPPAGQVRRIRIDGSYQPAVVHVRPGIPTRLIFRREETAARSERVVFPDFGMSVMLPPFEDVVVDLPAGEPGEHRFTCEMEMLRGRLVIDAEAVAR